MKYLSLLTTTLLLGICQVSAQQVKSIEQHIAQEYQSLETLYKTLHQNPELSLQEEKTSARIAEELRKAGFEVTEKVGGYGVVGVMKNGDGPTLLIRTDMDALPLEEKTGVPYASTKKATSNAGQETFTMHACGHDVHMTVFVGTARALSQSKDRWRGTLVMIGQPAEENGLGADAMLKAGLYERFPKPDYAIALHDNPTLPAGTIGYREGALMASVDMMDITVYGEGGHGAAPHTTIDPIVLSAQLINAYQTIISREINPIDPGVITVGAINGGTVHNIIPDQVKMQLTIRAYSQEVRNQMIDAIKRISIGYAKTAGLPEDKMPTFSIRDPQTPATVNDPALARRLVGVFQETFGREKVVEVAPYMVGEDFSRYGQQATPIPSFMFWLGAIEPEKYAAALQEVDGVESSLSFVLPSLHSPYYAPVIRPTLETGIKAMYTAALEILEK